jgi:ADP-sugar diphosphatase
VSGADLKALQGKATGLREEGELIKLQVVPFQDLWRTTSDAKSLSALLLYQNLLAAGAISRT